MTSIPPVSATLFVLGLATTIATLPQCSRESTATASIAQVPPPSAQQTEPPDPVRLLISGSMLGRLEPCGCASGQLGGLPRRMQHIGEQRNYDLLLEGGGLTEGDNELDILKASTAMMVLFNMQFPYDALGISQADLQLPLDEWLPLLGGLVPNGVVTSDLTCDREDWPGVPFVEKTVRDHTVRIASLTMQLPDSNDAAESPFTVTPPAEAWARALDGADDATLRVLMLHTTDTAARELVPGLQPQPDLVVCFDQSYSEPAARPETVNGVPLVYPGIRGRVMLGLTLARTADGPRLGYRMVPLPASKTAPGGGGDPDVKQLLLSHRMDVAESGVLQRLANQRPTPNGASYVGSQTCAGCHPSAMKAWKNSKHAHAWQTLVDAEKDPKRYGWPVTKYPDCVACHVVGYGEKSGFSDPRRTPGLKDVGCERCHGPGSQHMTNPAANPLGMIGGAQPSMMCVECHDFEQSPDFLYGEKWKLIEHGREPHMPPRKSPRKK